MLGSSVSVTQLVHATLCLTVFPATFLLSAKLRVVVGWNTARTVSEGVAAHSTRLRRARAHHGDHQKHSPSEPFVVSLREQPSNALHRPPSSPSLPTPSRCPRTYNPRAGRPTPTPPGPWTLHAPPAAQTPAGGARRRRRGARAADQGAPCARRTPPRARCDGVSGPRARARGSDRTARVDGGEERPVRAPPAHAVVQDAEDVRRDRRGGHRPVVRAPGRRRRLLVSGRLHR